MPGYAKQTGGGSKTAVFSNGTQVYSEKFYGFIFDRINGNLSINEVDNKSEIITIPDVEGDFDNEYQYWIWSGTRLKFYWDEENNPTRLLLEVT